MGELCVCMCFFWLYIVFLFGRVKAISLSTSYLVCERKVSEARVMCAFTFRISNRNMIWYELLVM